MTGLVETFDTGPDGATITTTNTVFTTVEGDPSAGPRFVSALTYFGTVVGAPRSGLAGGSGGSGYRLLLDVDELVQTFSVWVFLAPHVASDGGFVDCVSLAGQFDADGFPAIGAGIQIAPASSSFSSAKKMLGYYSNGGVYTTGPIVDVPTSTWLNVTFSRATGLLEVNGGGFSYVVPTIPLELGFTRLSLTSGTQGTNSSHYTFCDDLAIDYFADPPPVAGPGVVRLWPRDDGLGLSSGRRHYPPLKASRIAGRYQ